MAHGFFLYADRSKNGAKCGLFVQLTFKVTIDHGTRENVGSVAVEFERSSLPNRHI